MVGERDHQGKYSHLGKFTFEDSNQLIHRAQPNQVEVLAGGLKGIPEGLHRLYEGKVSGRKLVAHPQEE